MSTGVVESQEYNPLHLVESLNDLILVNDSKTIWNLLHTSSLDKTDSIIDFILDNSGYELFTDFCLAAYLTMFKFAKKIRFFVKQYPWFVSDVTANDFEWHIESMLKSEHSNIRSFGSYCEKCYKNGTWTIEVKL